MNKSIQKLIQGNQEKIAEIAQQNAIEFIGVFGSYSRNEQTKDSDLDLFIKFDFRKKDISLFSLFDLQNQLESLFHKKVDIVTKPNKIFEPLIQKDLITLYENR